MQSANVKAVVVYIELAQNSDFHANKRLEKSQNDSSGVSLDSPSLEFAGDSRRWVRRRTLVLQTPTNKEDPANSADPKGQKEEGNTAVAHASAR